MSMFLYSCSEDPATEDVEDPVASYQFSINDENPREVTFSHKMLLLMHGNLEMDKLQPKKVQPTFMMSLATIR